MPRYQQKAVLRAAVQPLLPPYVLERPKQGFCPPVASWCEQLLFSRPSKADGPLFESGLLNGGGLDGLRLRATREPFALWTLRMLTEWTDRNLDSAGVAEPEAVAA